MANIICYSKAVRKSPFMMSAAEYSESRFKTKVKHWFMIESAILYVCFLFLSDKTPERAIAFPI